MKFCKILSIYIIIIFIYAIPISQANDELNFFRIATGASTENLYRMATAISAGISNPPDSGLCNDSDQKCGNAGLVAVAQSKSGAFANIKAIANGQIESAIISADVAFWAYSGRGPFGNDKAFDDLRVIANLSPIKAHIIVAKNSPYKKINDLQNAKIAIGGKNTSKSHMVKIILKANGLNIDDMNLIYMRPGPATDALTSSAIDAMALFGNEPIYVIKDMIKYANIRILPFDNIALRKIQMVHPFIEHAEIAINTYGNIAPIKTFQLGVQWVVNKNIDSELIFEITKKLWQGQSKYIFNNANPDIKFPNISDAIPYGYGPPLHTGAKKYYKEIGLYK